MTQRPEMPTPPTAPPSLPPPARSRAPFIAYQLPLGRRQEGGGAAISTAVHLLIVIAVFWKGAEALLDLGAGGSGPRGGGGGGGRPAAIFFSLPAFSTPKAVEIPALSTVVMAQIPPPDIPVEDLAHIEVPKQDVPLTTAVGQGQGTTGGPGQGPGSGGGSGTGAGTGTGSDVGPGTGGGGGDIFGATPLGVILPASCLRGRTTARFWVAVDGRVTRVEMEPPPRDGGCRREMTDRLMGYKFRPATTRDGQPVASVFQIQVEH